MDNDLFWVGVILLILGIAGIYLALSGLSPSLKFGLQNLSALTAVLGLLFIPGGLIKGGLPRIGPNTRVVMGLSTTLALTGLLTASIMGINVLPWEEEEHQITVESPIKTTVTMIQGSYLEDQKENYVPNAITVVIGVNNTVIWNNIDKVSFEGKVSHTVTHVGGQFDSGLFSSGESWSYTFSRPGIFNYFCQPHPWMSGTVIASEAKPGG